jgi:hypothetical protein
MGRAVESLPAQQRLRHYREMATESLRLAHGCPDDHRRASHLNMAAQWLALATKVLSQIERVHDVAAALVCRDGNAYTHLKRWQSERP